MNLEFNNQKGSEKPQLEVTKHQQKELKYLGTYKKKIDGGIMFEYDISTKEVTEASYISDETYKIGGGSSQKLLVRPNCLYIEAINKKNAIRKFRKTYKL